jgi:RNA polymerase sigma factor (sigma-70 family)
MISEQEAKDLVDKYKNLKKAVKTNPALKVELRMHENLCVQKLKYLVTMKLGKYKTFSNYEDLQQEGFEALLKAIKTYNPNIAGNIFWWFHKYIDTRISRTANLHTTIRYPLRIAKQQAPHKEAIMPNLIEKKFCPDIQLQDAQTKKMIEDNLSSLPERQRDIIRMAFGLDDKSPCSTNKISKKTNMSRSTVIREMKLALNSLRENIKQ